MALVALLAGIEAGEREGRAQVKASPCYLDQDAIRELQSDACEDVAAYLADHCELP